MLNLWQTGLLPMADWTRVTLNDVDLGLRALDAVAEADRARRERAPKRGR